MGNEVKRIRIRVVPRSKIDFVSKRMCNFKSISSETEFFRKNKEENPLLAIGLGFFFEKQGGKSSPRQRTRILLRKTRREILCSCKGSSHFSSKNKEDYMSELYNHKVVEKKWQKVWDDNKAFAATDDYSKPNIMHW